MITVNGALVYRDKADGKLYTDPPRIAQTQEILEQIDLSITLQDGTELNVCTDADPNKAHFVYLFPQTGTVLDHVLSETSQWQEYSNDVSTRFDPPTDIRGQVVLFRNYRFIPWAKHWRGQPLFDDRSFRNDRRERRRED